MKDSVAVVVGTDPFEPESIGRPLLRDSIQVDDIADIKEDISMGKMQNLGLAVDAMVDRFTIGLAVSNPKMKL